MTDGEFRVVIPARYASTRLPGKVLLPLAGKPLLQHVYERCVTSGAGTVVIATDDDRVAEAGRDFGADVQMTAADLQSGTDRVAEVARVRNWDDAAPIVNVQGDAPLIPPESIRQASALLTANAGAAISTLCVPILDMNEYHDPHVVKVVFDRSGRALYFSRSPIPAGSHGQDVGAGVEAAWRHLGLYAYRTGPLQQLSSTAPCELERLEQLEQLRALWLGLEIRVAVAEHDNGPDVDTEDDLKRVEALLAANEG